MNSYTAKLKREYEFMPIMTASLPLRLTSLRFAKPQLLSDSVCLLRNAARLGFAIGRAQEAAERPDMRPPCPGVVCCLLLRALLLVQQIRPEDVTDDLAYIRSKPRICVPSG